MQAQSSRVFYIYCHTSPSGKRYIGQTCQTPSRRWGHGHSYKSNTHFSRAIEKYGWENFGHRILCVVHFKNVADLFEQHYIAKFDTFNEAHGYNQTMGGGGTFGVPMTEDNKRKLIEARRGMVLTEEQRTSISETLKAGYASGRIAKPVMSEEARARLSEERSGSGNPMYGKHHTPEALDKISARFLGTTKSEETRRRISESRLKSAKVARRQVDQFDLDGNFIATYRSIKEAAETVGDSSGCIASCLRGRMRRSKQFRWRYHEDSEFAFDAIRGIKHDA